MKTPPGRLSAPVASALILLCALCAVSCGRKTDPLVPASPRPEPVQNLQAVARDATAFLSWDIPARNVEGKEMNPAEILGFVVERAESDRDRKKARYKEVAEIVLGQPSQAVVRNGRIYWNDSHLRYGQVYAYRIRTVTARGGLSRPSEAVRVVPLLSLAPPARLAAEGGDGWISLDWDPVTTRSDGSAYNGFVGYNVYRSSGSGRQGETPLNKEPLRGTNYKDTSVRNNEQYHYIVRAVDSPARPWRESLDSPEATATARDRTPPGLPKGLTVVPGVRRIFLTWNENKDRDLAGYHVYRSRKSGSGHERLTDKPINRTTYSDEAVKPGVQYYYIVTAVDTSGNESAFSKEQSGYAEKIK